MAVQEAFLHLPESALGELEFLNQQTIRRAPRHETNHDGPAARNLTRQETPEACSSG
jgi:hypothetical protein